MNKEIGKKRKDLWLCIVLTRDCNFACKYCEVSDHACKIDNDSRVMKEDVIKKFLQLLSKDEKKLDKISMIFFGGEPLLKFGLIKQIVNLVKNGRCPDKYDFSIVTNGSLLSKEKADFFKKNNVHIKLSFDGNQETQDAKRVFKKGKQSTYEIVARNIKYFAGKGGVLEDVVAYMTISPDYVKNLAKDFLHMVNIGFREFNIVPAISVKNSWRWNARSLYAFAKEMDKIKMILKRLLPLGVGINFPEAREIDSSDPFGLKKDEATVFAIDTDGSVYYSIHFFVSDKTERKRMLVGNVFDMSSFKQHLLDKKLNFGREDLFRMQISSKNKISFKTMKTRGEKMSEIKKILKEASF